MTTFRISEVEREMKRGEKEKKQERKKETINKVALMDCLPPPPEM